MKIRSLLSIILVISLISCSQKLSPEEKIESRPLVNKQIDEDDLIDVTEEHTPPLAPNCKKEWDTERNKKCLSKFISMHVNKNLNLDLARKANIKGVVKMEINFVIDKEGRPVNITASGGPAIMNEDAINVINNLPKMEPGKIDGIPVNVKYKMPVSFMVAN